MNARDDIISAFRKRRALRATTDVPAAGGPEVRPTTTTTDKLTRFADRAKAAAAQVKIVDRIENVPSVTAEILRSRNLPAIVHLPPDRLLRLLDRIPWNEAGGPSISRGLPTGEDVAIAVASFAIAETGTLVYTASPLRPPSWHFRAGVEIAVISADHICGTLEDVLEQITKSGSLPSTINLVTGPSRTGDIEQTLELGAHGPRELVILIVPSLGGEHN